MEQEGAAGGHCNCGEVRFAIDVAVSDIYVCHCSLCRRATGSIGVTVVVVPTTRFRWLAGEALVRSWTMPGHDWHCCFCQRCGSHLPGPNDAETTYVPAGLLSYGTDQLQVKHHIWVGSKAPWHQIGDQAPQHPQGMGTAEPAPGRP